MSASKKLDVIGSTLVLLSAFAELFILSSFTSSQLNGYIFGIMENQSWLADMLRHIALGIDGNGLDQNAFSESRSNIKLYSETYDWADELFFARLIVGVSFMLGTAMIIMGKVTRPE